MENGVIVYENLYDEFCSALETNEPLKTPDITKRIKNFFAHAFHRYVVLPSSEHKEFLTDVFVATSNPRQIAPVRQQHPFRAILVVESELGGEGGSAPAYLKRNVFEDFAKLLVIRSDYKMMIFASIPYAGEHEHVQCWVDEMNAMYCASGCTEDMLLVRLHATPQKTANGNPTNPKISLDPSAFSGYILSAKGARRIERRELGAVA